MNNAVHAANLVATIVLSKLPVLRQFSHMFLTLAWRQRLGSWSSRGFEVCGKSGSKRSTLV